MNIRWWFSTKVEEVGMRRSSQLSKIRWRLFFICLQNEGEPISKRDLVKIATSLAVKYLI